MESPKEREWVVAEGVQGMILMPVLILTVGNEISTDKWEFTGYKFYPGSIDYVSQAFLYSSKAAALSDLLPVTTIKCWREFNPLNELIDDLIAALAKFQATL